MAAIALPMYEKAVEKSRAAEAMIMLKNAHDAYEMLELENPQQDYELTPKDILGWTNGTWNQSEGFFVLKILDMTWLIRTYMQLVLTI